MELKSLLQKKKGNVGELYPAILALTLSIILLGIGLIVLDNFWDQTDSGTEAYTAVNESIVGLGDFADWIPLIVIVIAMGVILTIVIRAFAGRRSV